MTPSAPRANAGPWYHYGIHGIPIEHAIVGRSSLSATGTARQGVAVTADGGLVCRDCGSRFEFSEDERQTFASQGYANPPSRCAVCRQARKKRQTDSGMRIVGPRFRESSQSTVTCSSCGASAVVPFAARAGAPVYCAACYRRKRADTPGA